MPTTLTEAQPHFRRTDGSTSVPETAGTGRHRGRCAEGDLWAAGGESVGHGRHRRTAGLMAPRPVIVSDAPGTGGRLNE
ncbi:hypothetical protein GCM10010220_67140 [Streptomyces parvulus]|uniref:Uncharacterized protein n=1 Tax=Streptomyces parvulus TaxID=146923 RepID=A0A191VAL1_9ACTN|nr:hypothetical protein Spa2297_33855 [Streptomyces parvulus]GGS05446.1 hypothetical protein GCM10010220_67140 [Streptomyces parvulus]